MNKGCLIMCDSTIERFFYSLFVFCVQLSVKGEES